MGSSHGGAGAALARRQLIYLLSRAGPFILELFLSLRAQFFWPSCAITSDRTLDIFGFQIVLNLIEMRFKIGLLRLYVSQLSPQL